MFYPYYARQLIANARLLSRFSPDANERAELVKSWKPIIELLGGDYSSLRPRQRKIFKLVLQGEYSEAWDRAILFSKLADKKNKAEQAAKNKAVAEPKYGFAASPASALNPALHARIMQAQAAHDRLKRRIHHVKASLSWRLTAPLRNVVKRGPG